MHQIINNITLVPTTPTKLLYRHVYFYTYKDIGKVHNNSNSVNILTWHPIRVERDKNVYFLFRGKGVWENFCLSQAYIFHILTTRELYKSVNILCRRVYYSSSTADHIIIIMWGMRMLPPSVIIAVRIHKLKIIILGAVTFFVVG